MRMRLTMLPMIFNMLVALAPVVLPTISTVSEFSELDETRFTCWSSSGC